MPHNQFAAVKQQSIAPLSDKKIKILFLAANPVNTAQLRLNEEVRSITTSLKLAKERDRLIFAQEWAVTPDSLMQAILDESPEIVHFSGHGETEGICLEDEQGKMKLVSTEALASLFRLFKDTVQCVLLNACYSEAQAKVITTHIPYVIGMASSIPDRTSIAFATGFYKAIGAGKQIPFAYDLGKTAIQLQGESGADLPVLLPYPKIEQLIPSLAALRPVVASVDRIARAGKQLKGLLLDFDLDDSLCKVVRSEFKRMEEEGIGSGDEELLEKIGNAATESEEWSTLVRFLESLDKKSKNAVAGPDYPRLAKQLARGEVILCLGQETSHLLGAQLPSTAEIKRHLSQEDFPGPLSELCEQKLIALESERKDLVDSLRELLNRKSPSPSVSLHELLARLDKPFIVISTCYDNLLQENLRARQRGFVEIYPNMGKNGECLLVCSDTKKEDILCTPDEVSSQKLLENGYVVIYRLRGGIIGGQERLLLVEGDYFAFNKVIAQQFPDYINRKLNSSLYSLWFIGHYPQSWEERLLVRFLRDMQHPDASALAVQENSSEFARNFWLSKKVKVHDLALTEFVQNLEAAL